jgi:phage portal protein BeeE
VRRSLFVRGRRVRADKTPRVVREARTANALAMLLRGMPLSQVAKVLGVNRVTLARNLKAAREEFAQRNADMIAEAVRPLVKRAAAGDWRALKLLMDILDERKEEE